jgi:putative hemolysin
VITGNMVQRQSIPPVETALPAATQLHPTIVDIRSGPLQVRLAETTADIDAAQALRYRIFYERFSNWAARA